METSIPNMSGQPSDTTREVRDQTVQGTESTESPSSMFWEVKHEIEEKIASGGGMRAGIFGLTNNSNECFINGTIQLLLALQNLVEIFAIASNQTSQTGIFGLSNNGNECFINGTIQLLLAQQNSVEYFRDCQQSNVTKGIVGIIGQGNKL
ncbi:uncharacterized protein LOC120351955 [Nilaparvata lugens]|uniref:uncharacterized protein LOC120351955 n=1 Tax=Nilaparvata lugens TaxID=108931 RepID=UPI00193E9062|nr:uncharacterized protein LOC120351955 [Nilaparvata lugens]